MKTIRACFFLCVGLLVLSASTLGQAPEGRDSLLKTAETDLRAKKYEAVIAACRRQLSASPGDYEFRFLLSRAYAFSNRWDEALDVLGGLLADNPKNTDVLIFQARIRLWKKEYEKAEAGWNRVLEIRPGDVEALTGLGDLAFVRGDDSLALIYYQQVIQVAPDSPAGYFGSSRVYKARGEFHQARSAMRTVMALDPKNPDYKNAWNTASLPVPNQFGFRYQYRVERFGDGRDDYINNQILFHFKVPRSIGSLIAKYNHTVRFGRSDTQFGLEIYPKLWTKSYGYIDIGYSPRAVHYPETTVLAELFFSLIPSTEMSLGVWHMNFTDNRVSLIVGSVGYYFGNYYTVFRGTYNPDPDKRSFSWTAQIKRFFTDQNYLYLGYGRGARPYEIITVQDLLIRPSWEFMAGLAWHFFGVIRLDVHFSTIQEEGGPRKDSLSISPGLRW
ncbi:MAG: YaiO family outer membrane beta-barrel protein [Candidatus Aminicenantes bacterium]|nr:YaiO family outer membrane beta-barrel protein [Candidatus Aminicenantes bacterium]